MRMGHALTLLGAALVGLGGVAFAWQRFELAGVSARGFEVPLVAQVVLGLAAVVALAAALGLVSARPRWAGVVTLTGSLFLAGWVAAAHVGRAADLPLMAGETIAMGPGYTLAACGAALALLGAVASVVPPRRPRA